MHLKGALHVHTRCSDGELTPAQVVGVYTDLGFDFIALTDHDYLLRPGCYNGVETVNPDMIVFKGVEMTIFEKGYLHINRIPGEAEHLFIFNHPSELDLPLPKVIERIQAMADLFPLDAIEITSKGFRTPEYEIDAIPYKKVATDDAHIRSGFGRAWIEMDCARDKDAIIRAIRKGEFWNCYA